MASIQSINLEDLREKGEVQFPLDNGRMAIVKKSRKSAVVYGVHLIVQLLEDAEGDGSQPPAECSDEEKSELRAIAEAIGEAMGFAGKRDKPCYRAMRNGPGLCARDHFHMHVLVPDEGVALPRAVDPVVSLPALQMLIQDSWASGAITPEVKDSFDNFVQAQLGRPRG
jgi:hypothetical protein